MKRRTALLAAAAALTGLGVVAFLNGARVLNLLSSNAVYRATHDVAYGELGRQRLDLYAPAEGDAPWPVVVFFYGGGWREGSKAMYEFVGSSLARAGYLVVVPDYRIFPEVTFPAFNEDAAAAVAWVQGNVADHGGDPQRVVLVGHSAGAYLAAMVTLQDGLLAGAGGDPARIAGFAGIAGPYDFLPLDEGSYLQDVFPRETRGVSQPVHHVRPGAQTPPILMLHGTADERVWPRNTRRLAAALEGAGAPEVEVIEYEGVGHRRIAAALAPVASFVAPTRGDLVDWLGRTTR